MEFVEYGNNDGQLVVYFHGAPGAVEECAVFNSHAKDHNLKIICFDRFSIDSSLDRNSYYQQLAGQIKSKAGGEPVDFIGFSIGTHVALEVSALLNGQVSLVGILVAYNSGMVQKTIGRHSLWLHTSAKQFQAQRALMLWRVCLTTPVYIRPQQKYARN